MCGSIKSAVVLKVSGSTSQKITFMPKIAAASAVAIYVHDGHIISSPGFKPIRFQDEIDAVRSLYGDDSMLNQVQVDDEMIKATQVRLKHSAYVRLLTTKMQITKRIVTLNKGG